MRPMKAWLDVLQRVQQQPSFMDRRQQQCHMLHNILLTFTPPHAPHRMLLEVRRAGWYIPPDEELIQLVLGGTEDYELGMRVRAQLPAILSLLREKPYTRRALLQFTEYQFALDEHDFVPVLIAASFRVLNDKLSVTVTARSLDVFLTLPVVYFQMTTLLSHMSSILGIRPGEITIFTNSGHLFAEHIPEIRELRRRYKNLKKPGLRQSAYG